MKNFLISLFTICLSFCVMLFTLKNSKKPSEIAETKNKIPKTVSATDNNSFTKKTETSDELDLSETIADYNSWKEYHKENIDLSTEFIAVDEEGNETTKKDFLEKLKTGNYIPTKLFDAEYMYQLYSIGDDADEKISKSIKSSSNVIYNYFLKEGKPFPEFNFNDLNDNLYSNTNMLGNILVIKCWFIQCKVCVEEFPKLNDLYDRYEGHDNIVFLSLAFDKPDKLKKFLTKKEFRYPVIAEQKSFMKNDLGIIQYPSHLIIDQYGDIKKVVNNVDSLILSLDSIVNEDLLPEGEEIF